MARTWHSNRRDQKDLLRRARVGDTYYGTHEMSQRLAPFEDAKLTGRWTVTKMQFGHPMCGSMPLEAVLQQHGPLTEEQPKGRRGIWEPSPQVAGPLGNEETEGRPLDKVEIRGLRKRTRDNTAEQKKAKRRGWL